MSIPEIYIVERRFRRWLREEWDRKPPVPGHPSLWGKMLNVEKARLDKVYGNDKLMPVVTALGCGIGDEVRY